MNDDLKLLVEWSSPWEEFRTAIRPALARSSKPLEAEAHSGLFPGRGMTIALATEAALLIAFLFLPAKFASTRSSQAAQPPKYDVIYFSGDELPSTQDAGGARSGRSGRSGGREGHHATQVIRVARGASVKEKIADAPKLNLPHSDSAVANLLAYKSVAGPPPVQGMETSGRQADMAVTAVPPPAAMQSENLQRAPDLAASAIAPSPSATQHELNSRRVSGSHVDVVPPPVSLPDEVAISNPHLTLPQSLVVAPAPSVRQARSARGRAGTSDFADQKVVPPSPEAANVLNGRQSVDVGNASVVAPASDLSAVASARHAGNFGDSRVVPPPAEVSGSLNGRKNGLSEAGSVVQPAPSASSAAISSSHRGAGGLSSRVVPPPAEVNGSITGRTNGLPEVSSVVQPTPSVSGSVSHRRSGSLGGSKVVPPPAQVNGSISGRTNDLSEVGSVVQPAPSASGSVSHRRSGSIESSRVVPPPAEASGALDSRANGFSETDAVVQPAPSASASAVSSVHRQRGNLDAKVVPPPAQMNGSMRQGNQSSAANQLSPANFVVQPAPSVSGNSGSSTHRRSGSLDNARVVPPTAQANGALTSRVNGLSETPSVIQPAPSASAASASSGQGRHAPSATTMVEAVVPPSPALTNGVVLSARPGSKLASPSGSEGSLAMSPAGGAHPGLGGTGNGAGISNGNGSGSSTSGEGPGAKTAGTGQGSSELAKNGISPFPGAGGAGKGTIAPPVMPGVSVSGGESNNIKLPSFGTDGAPIDPAHSPQITNPGGPGITVVASAHSGGAFNFYGALKGDKVYTIYIDTALGTAVMQFADPKSATQAYSEELTAPQALRAEVPSDLPASRLVIACTLDRTGVIRAARVVNANSPELSAKVMAALAGWKFRPVLRGSQPVEVNAILGFDIDTN